GDDPVVSQPEEHLRRHARPSHLEQARVGTDADAGRNRAGALQEHERALVAVHQPVSRDVGTERVPPGVSALRHMRDPSVLPADRRDARGKGMRRPEETAETAKTAKKFFLYVFCGLCVLGGSFLSSPVFAQTAGPVIVVETSKGTFEFETYPADAPK